MQDRWQYLGAASETCRGAKLSVLVLLTIVSTAWAGEDQAVIEGETGQKIAEWVKGSESSGFSGAVLAARGGEVVAAVGVGRADLRKKKPITPTTLFEIASATKHFTAIAVMQLAEQEKLQLDDSIAEHLPGVPEDGREITVRHLLSHTSGIPGTNSQGRGNDLQKVLPLFLQGGPRHTPGSHFEYWNQGYALLSEVIAQALGESYQKYCEQHIFEPAGMASTLFTGQRAPAGVEVAVGSSTQGKPRSALAHPYGSYGLQYRGMGGIVTNVWDLWRWDRALQGEKLLKESSKEEMFREGQGRYALGWYVATNPQGRRVQFHTGGVRGFICDIRRYPDEDGCVFVLCNRDDAPASRIATGVEQILFGGAAPSMAAPGKLDDPMIEALVGRYVDDQGREFIVKQEGNVARVRINWGPNGPVTNTTLAIDDQDKVVLTYGDESYPMELEREGSGPVQGFSLLGSRYRRVE